MKVEFKTQGASDGYYIKSSFIFDERCYALKVFDPVTGEIQFLKTIAAKKESKV